MNSQPDNTIELWATKYGRIHPTLARDVEDVFSSLGYGAWSAFNRVRIKVSKPWWGERPSFWVWRRTILWREGTINPPPERTGVKLYTSGGFAVTCHEIMHCYQYDTWPWWKWYLDSANGLIRSWMQGKRYVHSKFESERKALAFQEEVYKLIKDSTILKKYESMT